MRDKKRINKILKIIEKKWKKCPDYRLGQLLYVCFGFKGKDLFIVEDDVFGVKVFKDSLYRKVKRTYINENNEPIELDVEIDHNGFVTFKSILEGEAKRLGISYEELIEKYDDEDILMDGIFNAAEKAKMISDSIQKFPDPDKSTKIECDDHEKLQMEN